MWMEEMMTNYDDVWVVPVRAGIEYMKNPVEKGDLDFFEPFGCFDLPEFTCFSPRDCRSERCIEVKYCVGRPLVPKVL